MFKTDLGSQCMEGEKQAIKNDTCM